MTALRKVLVVDDDPAVRKSFDRVLSGKGYAVITAENGEEALRKLNEEKYDLVYSDIRMPGMSGLEVAEKVRARRPWTPVVIITGYGTDIAEERAKAAGVSKFLHKPLSPAMIEDSARDVLAVPAAPVAAAVTAAAPEAPVAEVAPRGKHAGKHPTLLCRALYRLGLHHGHAVLRPRHGCPAGGPRSPPKTQR